MSNPLHIRPLTAADLPFADRLRNEAGWNQTLGVWKQLMKHEPRGCLLAEWEGLPAGTATITRYGDEMGWIGMMLVDRDHQRKGIATALLERCMEYLRTRVSCVKLDATPEGCAVYEKLGFKTEGSLARWEGTGSFSSSTEADGRPIGAEDWDAIARFDRPIFGVDRRAWLEALSAGATASLSRTDKNGDPRAYAMLRPGARATALGPAVAIDASEGRWLLGELLTKVRHERVFWDIPDACVEAIAAATEWGFVRQRPFVRMRLGEQSVKSRPEWQWATADPAIG